MCSIVAGRCGFCASVDVGGDPVGIMWRVARVAYCSWLWDLPEMLKASSALS